MSKRQERIRAGSYGVKVDFSLAKCEICKKFEEVVSIGFLKTGIVARLQCSHYLVYETEGKSLLNLEEIKR